MFAPIQPAAARPRLAEYCSLAAHGLLLLWLLHPAAPKLVAPSFVVNGDHDAYIAHLYWLNQPTIAPNDSPGSSAADSRQQLNAHLAWKPRTKATNDVARS